VGVFYLQIKPQIKAFNDAKARVDAASSKGNETAKAQAQKELQAAIDEFNMSQSTLDVQMKQRMPNLDFSRRDIGMLALWKEQIKTLGPLLESFARDKSVNVRQAVFQIPAPPANPNDPIFDQDVLTFPLGTVQVSGDFKSLMNNIRRWNNCRRLVMVGAPTLVGTSPELTASYPVTCYIFPVAKGGSKIQMAGGGAAGAAGAAGAGAPGAPPMPASPPPGPMP